MEIPKWEAFVVIFVLIISGFALASSGQTVSHLASQVVPGSFAAGLYYFIGNLVVNDTLIVNNTATSGSALTVLGDINTTGNIYGASALQMIVGNLISLVSSGDIELNATSGDINMNSLNVYVNGTHLINYSDDSAPLEIYSGNSSHIPCPTGFGLAYYGWTYAGAGSYYDMTTNALLGGDLACIENDTELPSSLWWGESMPAPGVNVNPNMWGISQPAAWWLMNFTDGSENNITACTVCYPIGGEYVTKYLTQNTSKTVTCPAGFSKVFSTDGYVYIAGGEINSTGVDVGGFTWPNSVLTGGGITCVANPAQYVGTVLTGTGGGTLPTFWHASGGDYSRCNICYRPSVIV